MHHVRIAKPAVLFSFGAVILLVAACSQAPVSVLAIPDPLAMNARVLTMEAEAPGRFIGSWEEAYRTPIFMPFSLAQAQELSVDADSGVRWVFGREVGRDRPTFVAAPAALLATADWHVEIANSSAGYEIAVDVDASAVLELIACTSDKCWYEHADPLADAGWLSFTVHKSELPVVRSGWPGPLSRFRVTPTLQIQVTDAEGSRIVEFATLTMALSAGDALLTYLR